MNNNDLMKAMLEGMATMGRGQDDMKLETFDLVLTDKESIVEFSRFNQIEGKLQAQVERLAWIEERLGRALPKIHSTEAMPFGSSLAMVRITCHASASDGVSYFDHGGDISAEARGVLESLPEPLRSEAIEWADAVDERAAKEREEDEPEDEPEVNARLRSELLELDEGAEEAH